MSGVGEFLAATLALVGLGGSEAPIVHGYVEGEYSRIAASSAGFLEKLSVTRGERVAAGAPLFAIDRSGDLAERDRLAAALDQARAQLADLATGKRVEEIAVTAAQRDQAKADAEKARIDLGRQRALEGTSAATREKFDTARTAMERAEARVDELDATLIVAKLPSREQQIRAAEAAVRGADAALAKQERRIADLAPVAPEGALVDDTMYNPGEWVPAGATVVSLLPPDRVKLVVFAPEPLVTRFIPGAVVKVSCDGCSSDLKARVVHVSASVEYTPPVIYSVGSREKLVHRVELKPDRPTTLPPGLPVDVEPSP